MFLTPILLLLIFAGEQAGAAVVPPPDPIREALSETVPTGFISGSLSELDYRIEWKSGAAPAGMEAELVPGSVEWSRVSDSVLIPRVRMRVRSQAASPILARVAGVQTLLPGKAGGGTFLVPLSSLHEITLRSGNDTHALRLTYQPQDHKSRVFVDHTCSPYKLRSGVHRSEKPFWIWIGCRAVHNMSHEKRRQTLELFLVSDAGTKDLLLNQVPLEPLAPGLTALRIDPSRQTHLFQTERGTFALYEKAGSEVPYGFIGAGLGPYRYTFQSPGVDVKETAPLATIYGSYALTDSIRLTAFNATVIHRQLMTDSGVYLNSESFRAFDRRISFHVMLGMNAVGAKMGSSMKFRLGAPQGIEATWRDFGRRDFSLNGGAFIYPKIDNTAYYNLWVRYGSRGYFFEVNYLSIRNELGGLPFFSKAVGLSVGVPLFRMF